MATINFNDGIYAQTALEAFVATLQPLRAFARDFSGETAQKGNAVYVPRVDATFATTFSGSYTVSGGTVNTITVNLDRHKIAPVDITDVQSVNSSPARAETFARQQGKALGKAVLQDIWSVITAANFGAAAVTTAVANWGRAQLAKVRKALADKDVDMDSVSFIANTAIYDALLNDTSFNAALNYGGSEAIREGKILRALGFDVYESNVVPANGESLAGFGVHPDAIAVAMRYLPPQDAGAYADARLVTDPETGFTFGYRRHMDPNTGKLHINMEALYGFAVGISTGLVRVTVP